jgi:2-amino-4-hydroxy-6-hydroxymethyldihydropteridine diphosphokinase
VGGEQGALRGYLGLGANLGDRRAQLEAAAGRLAAHGVAVEGCSSVYETQPVGEIRDQPPFANAALRVCAELDPETLLAACQAVERELGRTPGRRHAPRPIDVDVLLLDDHEHSSPRLRVPHPGLLERRFALIGVLELDFAARTPAGAALADALARLPVAGQDVRWAGPPLLGLPAPGVAARLGVSADLRQA